jgi:hypothetical protein
MPPPRCEPEDVLDLESLMALNTVLDAAQKGDVVTLASLVKRLPKFVTYNRDRGSLQIRSCGGAVVANLPISHALAHSIRAIP